MNLRKPIFFIAMGLAALTTRAALTDYQLQPSADGTVSSLASVKITFPEAKFLGMYGSRLEGVTLTSKADPAVVYEPCNISYSTYFSSNSETFSLRRVGESAPGVVSEPGEYVLHFPEGCFDLCGDWYTHLGYSKEIDVTYTVGKGGSGFDEYFDPATVAVRPLPGDIMEFRDITVSFPVNEKYPTIDIIDPSLITLTRAGEGVPEYVFNSASFDGEGSVNFNFRRAESAYPHPEYMWEPGVYTVNIPAGVFRLTATNIVNEAMELKYTVTGANSASGQLRKFLLTPEAGKTDRIESIVLEYPDLKEALSFPDGVSDVTAYVAGRVSLRRLDADPDLCSVYEPCSAILRDGNKIEMRFRNRVASSPDPGPETITRMGDYQLTVLPNTFKLKSNTFAFNARVEAYYTVTRDMPSDPMAVYMLDPSDGEGLDAITTISLTFPEATEGLDFPVDKTMITLTNADDSSDVYEARGLMIQGNKAVWGWNRPDFAYDDRLKIVKEGTYRLEIRPGAFRRYGHDSQVSPAITASFNVSPDNEFSYTVSPEPGRAYTGLTEIRIIPADGATDIRPTRSAAAPATLRETSGKEYRLSCGEDCVFNVPEGLPVGNYTFTVPEGYLVQTNARGKKIYNKKIAMAYRVALPAHFEASIVPPSGSTVSGLTSVSVTPTGAGLRGIAIDPDAGTVTLDGGGTSICPSTSVSQYGVAFIFPDDTLLEPGRYTLKVPAGYITVTDGNGLQSRLDAIEAVYTVAEASLPAFAHGIFFLNEGAYGSDFGSLNYLDGETRTLHYRVFSEANHGRTPGVTPQFGCIHGDRMYLMSKQASYSDPATLFTIAGSHDLEIEHQLTLPGVGGRAVCPVNGEKAYLGTSDGIYVCDVKTGRISGPIEGTSSDSGLYRDQAGDMVRMGRYVFAAVQSHGVFVIDTDGDTLASVIELPGVSSVFVTGGGRLFASVDNDVEPFVEIDPETFETSGAGAGAEPVASQWGSWRSAPLTSAIRGNRVFYVTGAETSRIACYDFDSGVFEPRYMTLPTVEGVEMKTYGTALSTDPSTGYVVVTATGGADSYDRNLICFADPSDGHLIDGLNVYPDRGYWFPAMSFYTVARAPEINIASSILLDSGEETPIDLPMMTYLSEGNPHLIIFSASSSDNGVCALERQSNGRYMLRATGEGSAVVTLSADYRGLLTLREIEVTVWNGAGVEDIVDDPRPGAVYDLHGRMVLRDATPEQISRLPRGVYIIGGKKLLK